MFRKSMSRSRSRKLFSRTAARSQSINFRGAPMRGGLRL